MSSTAETNSILVPGLVPVARELLKRGLVSQDFFSGSPAVTRARTEREEELRQSEKECGRCYKSPGPDGKCPGCGRTI